MLSQIKRTFSNIIHSTHAVPITFLSVLFIAIFISNFPINSWLIGWDNLLPELNFPLNVSRAFNAGWIFNQGLGHVGGHGHAANLPHTLVLWLMSFLVPSQALRPLFLLGMYVAGAFGAYALTYSLLKKQHFARFAGVIAALLYSFNLGTIQQFFTPLESFIIFHGLLPWVLLLLFSLLNSPKIPARKLLGFFILSWFFSAIGFLPPLFVVYGLILACIFGAYLFAKRSKTAFKRILLIGIIILTANLYWLSSVAYFTATSSSDYLNAQNNQLSTDGYNWQSISNGGLLDVALVRGFLYWALDVQNTAANPLYVMQPWYEHYQNPVVISLAVIWFFFALVGIGWSLTRPKRDYRLLALSLVFLLMIISLGQRIPGISMLSQLIKELPVINQAFRAAFTKVSVPFVLSIAVLAGVGLSQSLGFLEKWLSQKKVGSRRFVVSGIIGFSLLMILIFGLPVISGHLFSDHLKQTFPSEYAEVISFFKDQPSTERIAILPLIEHWGWHYYDWGYIGSGFWWYGIEQPILDRSFDSWSRNNETFYHQLNAAIQDKDAERIVDVLNQYQVRWLILDSHLTKASGDHPDQQLGYLQQLFAEQGFKPVLFDGIIVYENPTDWQAETRQAGINRASGNTTYTSFDPIWHTLGNYISGGNTNFPFASLSSTHGIALNTTPQGYTIDGAKTEEIDEGNAYEFHLPQLTENIPALATATASVSGVLVTISTDLPKIQLDNQVIDINEAHSQFVPFPTKSKNSGYYVTAGDTVQKVRLNATTGATPLSLSPETNTPIQLFMLDSQPIANISEAVKWAGLSNCVIGGKSSGTKIGAENGTTVNTAGEKACFSAEVGSLFNETTTPQLYTLKFDYSLEGTPLEHLCLSREEDNTKTCYSGELSGYLTNSGENLPLSVTFQLPESGNYWLDVQVAPESQFAIKNVILHSHERVASNEIASTMWEIFESDWSFALEERPKNAEVMLPQREVYRYPLLEMGFLQNCDVFNRGSTTLESRNNTLIFSATNGGISCLPLSISNQNMSSIITLSGKQIRGKRPEISVLNLSTNETEYELTPIHKFTLGIPRFRQKLDRESDQLTFTARSFPNTTTEMSIDDMQTIPVPLRWLSMAEIRATDSIRENLTVEQVGSNAWIRSYIPGNSAVVAITLPQSFDSGWVAFPSWQPWQQFEHVVYNGWANAWIIPPTSNGESNQIRVTMLYWPQLLSYAGYGLLLATLLWLGVGAWRERKSSNSADADEQMYSETISGRAVGAGGATPTPHFTPLSIEKLFTGGSLGADFNREWKLFQKEVVSNTLLISHDLQSAWHRVQHAVRNLLKGKTQ